MKILSFIAWILVVILLIYVLPSKYYKGVIYLLFVLLSMYRLSRILVLRYKTKPGIFCEGQMMSYNKEDPDEKLEVGYRVRIEFISPTNNEKYTIWATEYFRPVNKKYTVWLNQNNPEKAIVVKPIDLTTIFLFSGVILIFSYLLYKELISL